MLGLTRVTAAIGRAAVGLAILSLAAFILAGCSSFDLRKGPSPILDGAAVRWLRSSWPRY